MNAEADLLGQPLDHTKEVVRPLEPLYSMLAVMPVDSLKYTLNMLQNFDNDTALDDRFENVGLSRRDYIKQVLVVMSHRGIK